MTTSLNGIWEYRIGKGEFTKRSVPFSQLAVGHSECQRYFNLDTDSDVVLLKFDGITYEAKVFLNGKLIGTMLPYSEYVFDITDVVAKKDNHLLVEIEDIDASFGPSEGWENFGGIIRDVSLIYKNKGYLKDVYFAPTLTNGYKDATYTVKVLASLPLDFRATLSYKSEVVDTYISSTETVRKIENVRLWSPDSPALYDLKIELLENGTVVDTHKMAVGFSELKCEGNHFYLNGEKIFLKGVCRHEMCSESSGHTVSYDDIYKDMKMIKDTGCNFVRLVHYPHCKKTLDIADELGLLVCEEPGMWQADVFNPKLTDACLEVLKRVVIRDRSHPSVAFWLAFNECDFYEGFLKKAVKICREHDKKRLVSGANNMSNEETRKYYNLCDLDFYTMHPYSDTFEMARKASEELNDKPLMFTEWGGYYVYDKPEVLTEFLLSMYELYKNGRLAGTCLWYFAEIKDYNRGAPACQGGTLKEALLDFERKPTLIYDAFCKAISSMGSKEKPSYKNTCQKEAPLPVDYESKKHISLSGEPLKATVEPSIKELLSVAKEPLKTHLAKTRKKQITHGPVAKKGDIFGVSEVPFLLSDTLCFEGDFYASTISILGMTSLNYGYPILGKYGEDVLEIIISYEGGDTQRYVAKNGEDVTIAYLSVGSSRINPIAENARRAMSFSYDKNFEEYIVSCLEIKTLDKKISGVTIKSLNKNYNVLIYGILKN